VSHQTGAKCVSRHVKSLIQMLMKAPQMVFESVRGAWYVVDKRTLMKRDAEGWLTERQTDGQCGTDRRDFRRKAWETLVEGRRREQGQSGKLETKSCPVIHSCGIL